jgi:hypothetical protein
MKAQNLSIAYAVFAMIVVLPGRDGVAAAQPSQDGSVEIGLSYGKNREPISFAQPIAEGLRLAGFRDVRVDGRTINQQTLGFNLASHLSRYVRIFSEFMYNDLGETRLSGRVPFTAVRANFVARMKYYEWTVGPHVQLPTGTWRVRPYLGGGAGFLLTRISGEAEGISAAVGRANDFTYHLDLGVRMFMTPEFGFAPEFRFVNLPDESFQRVLINAVFRFQ